MRRSLGEPQRRHRNSVYDEDVTERGRGKDRGRDPSPGAFDAVDEARAAVASQRRNERVRAVIVVGLETRTVAEFKATRHIRETRRGAHLLRRRLCEEGTVTRLDSEYVASRDRSGCRDDAGGMGR